MKKSLLLTGLLCACFSHFLSAQVKTTINSSTVITEQGRFARSYQPRSLEVPIPDLTEERKEKTEPTDKLLKIAKPVPADIDVVQMGNWTNDGQFAYGKLTLHAKGAQSLSINFDRFYLPPGTELYVYNEKGNMITGPVTDTDNNARKVWGSWVYKGEYLTIEVKTYAASQDQLQLHIGNIAYGYKELYRNKVVDFGASGSCNVNVICATTWPNEKNAVGLLLNGSGSALCSGSLIVNNGCTATPYFLTADHCFQASNDVANWRFTFQAYSATCSPTANADGITFNGSTLRANWSTSDFCLVELNTTPASSTGLYYAGWSKLTTTPTSFAGIHHPSGDVMKISRVSAAPSKSAYLGGSGTSHWQVNWVSTTNGITEGGSSGSPLFDQDHRIRGQLHGGYSSCTNSDLRDWYGALDQSYTGGGSNSTRLSNWLDPASTGVYNMNTTSLTVLAGPGAPAAPSLTAIKTSASGEPTTYEFTATLMSCVTYNWYVGSTLQQSGSSNTFDWYFPCNQTRTVYCSITSAYGTSALSSGISRTGGCDRTRIAISPNPVTSLLNITTTDKTAATAITEVRIYDYQGTLKKRQSYNKVKSTTLSVRDLPFGTYYVEVSYGEEKERKLIIIQR